MNNDVPAIGRTCGSCGNSFFIKEDMHKVGCRGIPPQILIVPGPGGRPQTQQLYPAMALNEPACGMYKPKFIDMEMPKKA